MFRPSETTEVSMEETHHQFVYGTRNLWRRMASLLTFSYEVHPYCCQTIGTTTFNSAQSPTQEFKIVCLQSANVTGTSVKRHAKTKKIYSEHAATNFEDEAFLKRVCFSDEATFHLSGKLNKHNVRIWGSENPHASRELQRDSPKVNVWCGIMCLRATNGAHIEVY